MTSTQNTSIDSSPSRKGGFRPMILSQEVVGEGTGHSVPARAEQPAPISGARRWTGRIITGLVTAFLLFDGALKLVRPDFVVKATVELGYPPSAVLPLGIILLACVVAYLVPRLSVLGAILLTGYLGGAIATHVRVGDPLLSHTLFPIYVAILVWGGLALRDGSWVRALFARRSAAPAGGDAGAPRPHALTFAESRR